uniref:Uncharacterized protein n=1 Tax=Anguilla anguilla TaxID=7936 RepID=A0A0E9U6N9_ANGAN
MDDVSRWGGGLYWDMMSFWKPLLHPVGNYREIIFYLFIYLFW